VTVLLADSELEAKALIDTGSEIDIISASYALKLGIPRQAACLPRPTLADNSSAYCYGAYLVKLRLSDSTGRVRECERLFYALDRRDPLILGLPFTHDEKVQLDCEEKAFR